MPKWTGLSEENALLFGETCLVAFCVKEPVFTVLLLWERTETKISTFIYNLGQRPKVMSAGNVSSIFISRGGRSIMGGAG